MCHLAQVSKSGYYKWLKTSDELDSDYEDYLEIKTVFEEGKRRYGWRRLKMRLPEMNHKKIQRIMRKYGLRTKIRKRNPYKQMMKENLEHRTFPNVLKREFKQSLPQKVFCTDITYIHYEQNLAYLSALKDVASGEIVSWKLSRNLGMNFVLETINTLETVNCAGSIIHSDQGFHYTNPTYIKTLRKLKIIQSMSAKGKCIDNSPIESFFGHLKDELDYKSCKTFAELNLKIDEYMRYYNHERKQWTRNKMSPIEYSNYLRVKGSKSVH